jgi:cyclic pyranopterin phosphate synthase
MPLVDLLGRPLRSLRVSVTDRCNLRCQYCMPEEEYAWLPREGLLTFEEIVRLVAVLTSLGVNKVRLTGGEPLLRRQLPDLVSRLASNPRLEDIALTTNGVLLADQAAALHAAGLHRVTVSLDTLDPQRFLALTRLTTHARVLHGIGEAARLFGALKIDTVLMRDVNDDEMAGLIEYARGLRAEVRFIEYMDVAGATHWSPERVVPRDEILRRISQHYGPIEAIEETAWAPADRFRLPDGTVFGVIASTTSPFCGTCDRARLTADGVLFTCLYAREGLDLRKVLRGGATPEALADVIGGAWRQRADRGAELRLAERERGVFVTTDVLKKDPHLEMHTKGG